MSFFTTYTTYIWCHIYTTYIWCQHLVFECSALNGIRLRFPHLFTGFHTMSSFKNKLHNGTSCISSLIIVCEHSHDNLELGVVPALEPAMLSHSYSLAKPLSSRCVAC